MSVARWYNVEGLYVLIHYKTLTIIKMLLETLTLLKPTAHQ